MVSREGEEAEYHETDSNISTPPRMGSMKISSRDPLQNRLSMESCSKFSTPSGELPLCDYDQVNQMINETYDLRKTSSESTVKSNTNKNQTKDVEKESIARVPPITRIEDGAVELKDLENGLSTTKEHQQKIDVWDIPKEYLKSDSSNAKSRRNCWVSNDHAKSGEPDSTTAVKTPKKSEGQIRRSNKKVNFRSVEEELKPVQTETITNKFSNGVYKGAKGFDVDPPPSYIDYSNHSKDNGDDKKKTRETKKSSIFTSDEASDDKESESADEKSVEIKSVPFLSLFRFASCHDKLLIFIGILGAICGGASLPFMIVLFGSLGSNFVTNDIDATQICNTKYFPQCCSDNGTLFAVNQTVCQYVLDNITGQTTESEWNFFESITRFGVGTAIIGFTVFVMSYIFVTCLNHAAENQAYKIRQVFLTSVLRQNIGWYDTHQTSDFAAKMADDLDKFQEGIGEKIGMCVFFMTIFSANIVNAIYHGWQLTLVMMAPMPVLILSMSIIAKSQTLLTEKEFAAYGKAGAIAEEVLSSIRTVVAFGGQKKEVQRFEKKLTYARRAGIMRGVLVAVGGAIMWLVIYGTYALAFWYGVKLIMDDRESCLISLKECIDESITNGTFDDGQNCEICMSGFDPAALLIVFFSVLMGAMNIGQASPYVEAFSIARAAAAAIFAVIDRVPEIDSFSDKGAIPKNTGAVDLSQNNNVDPDAVKTGDKNSHSKVNGNHEGQENKSDEWINSGKIIFDNVFFKYPARPEVEVLQGLNLTINKGETVALVGPSGCGKSTVIQLVQRFYDPESGSIKLGGKDIREVNLRWMRERIGIVGQEPVLFGCTIAENIKQGRKGVTQEEMEKACVEGNAYNFIKKLPKKFDTLVGERGAQLSGGQKQRIAIARALVRNPDILLLDEATSALDTQSESVVQIALDKARSGRTTIVVAHRLSTIRTADKIVAIKDGQVVETGSHEELMNSKGLYHALVLAQTNQEFESLDSTEYPDKSGESGDENRDNIDEVIDLSLGPLSSIISSTSTVLTVPAVPQSIMVNNFVNNGGNNNSGQCSSIPQVCQPRRKSRHVLERKISVASIMSDDSTIIEEASRSLGSAVGFSRMGSTGRGSRRRSTLNVPRRQSVMSRRSSVGIDDRHLSDVTASNNVEEILKAEDLPKINTFRIFSTNSKEWHYILMGSLASIVMGASMPVYAFLFGEMLGLLSGSIENARNESYFYSIMFLFLGVAVAIGFFFQIIMFATAGEHLTQRMRKLAFEAMLRQEMGWFDDPSNSTGALCSRLSADAGALQGATGARGGAIVQAIFTIVLAICAGIYHEWKLGLVGALFVPVVLIGSKAQAKIISSQDNLEKEALETSAKLAIEAITNIRTVAGLGREKTFVKRYVAALKGPHQEAMKKSHLRGLVFGFAQSTPFFAYAGCMYYGGYLVETDGLPFKKCFQVAEALILGTMMVGQASAFQPNYNKAVIAAGRIFKLLDRKPLIDSDTESTSSGLRLDTVDGDINFKNARFQYPTRPEVNVLRELNLALTHGQKVAIVGPSGCGKSTCIQLLQRLYDLKSGDVCLDNHNINSLNVPWLRSTMGIVSQEPVLFDRTLAENIQYGDNERDVSMDDVVDAARRANIHSFIASLPQGYQTRVGEKGTQLSGGQKQRVAIARALVRNPTILLLDEATSALDSESEKVVQDALDAAQEGRTSITIAHRLSTVIHSDVIFVISHGRVVEKGTHLELLASNGLYQKLWSAQTGVGRVSRVPSFKVSVTSQ